MNPEQIIDFLVKFGPHALKIAGMRAETLINLIELLIKLANEQGIIEGKTAEQLGEMIGVSKQVIFKATKFLRMFGIIEKTKGRTLVYELKI